MSDSFDRNLVILIFIGSFMYMNFVSIQLRTRTGWSNLTCNPMNLFTNSLFQSQELSNKEFERCVTNLSTLTSTNIFKKQKQDQERVLANISGIKNNYTDLTTQVNNYVVDASAIAQEYSEQIDDLKVSQSNSNVLNKNTTTKVKSFLTNLDGIMRNIADYFKNK